MNRGNSIIILIVVFFSSYVFEAESQALHPNKPPYANFKGHKKHLEPGGTVHFTDLSAHNPTSWQWFFEGGLPSESSIENPHNILYPQAGAYNVTLIVSNEYGTDTLTKYGYIKVSAPELPIAKFHSCKRHLFPGGSTNFKDQSKNDPLTWNWIFEGGDPPYSVEENPQNIVFNDPGTFDITLIVSNEVGSDTLTRPDYIVVCDTVVCEPPLAAFEVSTTEVMIGQGVAFFDMSENEPEGWQWIFEGGQPGISMEQGPVNVVYDAAGTYDVTLIVFNDCGADTIIIEDQITVVEMLPLRADFFADETSIIEGTVVQFTDLSAGDPTFWIWEIEGASPSITYSQNPTVMFNLPGVYKVSLTVQNGVDSDIEFKEGYISVGEEQINLPPGWEYNLTPSMHAIAIPMEINPNILGFPLVPGDYIGVFYLDDENNMKCAGAEQWNGESNIAVLALGNSPYTTEKDGFDVGEEFTWKIYNWWLEKEFDAIASYEQSLGYQGTFFPLGFSALTNLTAIITCQVPLSAGWGGVSSPVNPLDPEINNVLQPILDELIMINNFDGINWPGAGVNTLLNWDNLSGYNIKMDEDVTLTFIGVSDGDGEISVEAGWNYIPVPVMCEKDIIELLGPDIEHVLFIRETSGFKLFWPQFNYYTLENLEPGRSYLMLAEEDFDIYFPACENLMKNNLRPQENSRSTNEKWNTVHSTNSVHTIAITEKALSEFQINDQIGVLNAQGYCSGFETYTGGNMVISVFGDDITTQTIDGLMDGEELRFMRYRQETENINELEVMVDPKAPNRQWFTNNGISVIKDIKLSSTGLSELYSDRVNITPNPGSGSFDISGIADAQRISVLSPNGKKVLQQSHDGSLSHHLDITNQTPGIYILIIEGEHNPIIKKLILQKQP